jgi:hypothetical protein
VTAANQEEREAARFALAVDFRDAQTRGEALRPLARLRGVSEGVPAQYVKVLSWLEEAKVPETAERFNRALRAYYSGKDARIYLTRRAPEIGAESDVRERDRLFEEALSIAAPVSRVATMNASESLEDPTTETGHLTATPEVDWSEREDVNVGGSKVEPSAESASWIAAFPWLRLAAADLFGDSWWLKAIDKASDTTRRIAAICELAASHFRTWSVGELFPGLATDTRVEELYLFPRALNTLVRQGYRTTGDLESVTVAEMFGWRQVGAGTVDAILQALARATIDSAGRSGNGAANLGEALEIETRAPVLLSESSSHNDGPSATSARLDAMIEDLETIAGWLAAVGRDDPVLTFTIDDATPPEVLDARSRILALQSTSVLNDSVGPFDVAALLDDEIARLDDRTIEIVAARLFADSPQTLDEIGRAHGVTRERVRQLEAKARASLMESLEDGSVLAMVGDSISRAIGTVTPLSALLKSMPALDRVVETISQPAWRVLDRLDDTYEIEDGWCGSPTLAEARAATTTLLSEISDQYGVAHIEDIGLVGDASESETDATASWLTKCGYIVDRGYVLTRTSSVGDYAAAVLSIAGSPLSAQEIVDRFVFDRSAGSIRNAMSTDDRFERVDRDRWALKEWGMEAYGGIRSVIRELVAKNGGRARLDYVVEYVTERYSVSTSSVIAYAAAAPFSTKDGVVQRASEGQGSRKPPERTKRLFRRPDGWAYRVRISTDHLRGSGSVAPLAIATICDLKAGETKQLPSPLGPQAVAWTGLQPSFGTIRRFLLDEDVAAESEAFLVIRDDGSFAFERARNLTGDALNDAQTLVGAEPAANPESARLSLARALRIPDESPVSSIIGAYRARGDDDVADLVLAARVQLEQVGASNESAHSADVDEILDLL